MSNLSMVDKTDDAPPGDDSMSPQPVGPTVLQAADIPKASPEALDLLKSIGKYYYTCFIYDSALLVRVMVRDRVRATLIVLYDSRNRRHSYFASGVYVCQLSFSFVMTIAL